MAAKWTKVSFNLKAHLKGMTEKVAKYANSRTSYTGDVEGYQNPDGTCSIYVESPNAFHLDLPDLFKDDKHFYLLSTERKAGSYDWASGVYIKDCDMIHFELKP